MKNLRNKKNIYRPFKAGVSRIPRRDFPVLRSELMRAWGITSATAWYERLRGERALSPAEVDAAERIFAKYGVKRDQIWGKDDGFERPTFQD